MPSMHFSRWDSIDPSTLNECARVIGQKSLPDLSSIVTDHVRTMQDEVSPSGENTNQKSTVKFTLSTSDLLSIPGCLLTARFKGHPFKGTDLYQVNGMARLIQVGSIMVPSVFIFKNASDQLIAHESIHACQFLGPHPYPLSAQERQLLVSRDLTHLLGWALNQDGFDAIDLISRVCAFKIWTEIEAYQFSYGQVGLAADDLLERVFISAQPFQTLDRYFLGTSLHFEAEDKLKEFCDQMEKEHSWIGELVSNCTGSDSSLYNALESKWVAQEDEEWGLD